METHLWDSQIDSTTAAFKDNFTGLTEEQLNWKPDANTWSVAQNIHHLIVINKTYYPIIEAVRAGTYSMPWVGKFKFMTNFFGTVILKSVSPDRKKKMKTFPPWEPSGSHIAGDIISLFDEHQAELKKLIHSCADLLERDTVISSPANKNIVYPLKSAFDIIVTHERRHLQQAKEVNEWRMKNTGK